MVPNASMPRGKNVILQFMNLARVLVLTVLLLVIAAPSDAQETEFSSETQLLTMGVLTQEGATRALEAWRPTIDLLNQVSQEQELPYRFSVTPHEAESLKRGLSQGELDFALTNPALFVATEVENGARAVLSQAHMWEGRTYNRTGAVVFVKADSPVRQLGQLSGGSVMAVSQNDFGGWMLAEQEFRRRRLDPYDMLSELVFSDGNAREVVYAVQSGLVDAGVVQAGTLEKLAKENAINLDDFAPVSPALHSGFPFWSSTPLFPEWVLLAMPDVPEPVLALVINTLLNVGPDSPVSIASNETVWQAPQNYQQVHDLLISLRVPPYENYLMQAAGRIYRTYRWPILGFVFMIFGSLLFLTYQLRRNLLLAEKQKNTLQSEIRSKVFYRSAVEEHTVFCMLRLDGRISHVNASFCETTARRRSELMNQPLANFLPSNEQEVLREDIMRAMEIGAPWEGPLKILREDGTKAWVQCTVIPVSGASNELSEIALVATDMTQTRKGISEDSFHDSLELMQDQVLVLEPGSLKLLYCNRAADELLIKNRVGGEWKGRFAKDIITSEDLRSLELRCQALVEGPRRRVTWEVTAQIGTPYEISLEYVEPENDEPRFIAIYRDITQRKVAEKAKNEFVATVSHELRTPLTSMKGALGLALSGAIGEMPEQMNKMISMASNNCDRLVSLINDMLDVEKMEAGKMDFKMDKVDLAEVVQKGVEANTFYADKFGVTLKLDIPEEADGYFTMGEKDRLTQVMDNLLSNASKFSEKGSEVLVSLREHRGRLRLSVRDFGCGIPAGARATIFDKFTQADMGDTRTQQGTGLGLSIAKAIVEGHNGSIFFASEEQEGTEFYVDLPRLVDEEVLPMEDISDEEVRFSHQDTVAADELETANAVAVDDVGIQSLMGELRSGGFQVDMEAGAVTVSQVVSGKGVVGQSSVLNWLSESGRTLVGQLFEQKKLANRAVTVIQADASQSDLKSDRDLINAKAAMYVNWVKSSPQFAGGASDRPSIMAVSRGEMPDLDDAATLASAQDNAQAMVLADNDDFDAILHFDRTENAHCAIGIPVDGGRLPETAPVVLIVSQGKEPEAERGVVSKFSRPSGGGRGRARRRRG